MMWSFGEKISEKWQQRLQQNLPDDAERQEKRQRKWRTRGKKEYNNYGPSSHHSIHCHHWVAIFRVLVILAIIFRPSPSGCDDCDDNSEKGGPQEKKKSRNWFQYIIILFWYVVAVIVICHTFLILPFPFFLFFQIKTAGLKKGKKVYFWSTTIIFFECFRTYLIIHKWFY